MATALRTPIPLPDLRYCTPPVRPAPLDPSSTEAEKLKEVHEHFAAEGFELESDGVSRPFDDEEKMYLASRLAGVIMLCDTTLTGQSQELFQRFLKATKGSVPNAIKRIEACMQFRRANNLYDLRGVLEEIRPEWASGKSVALGFSRKCQPIYYTWTAKNDQPPTQRSVLHMMYSMERVIDLLPAGVQTLLFAADLKGKTQTSTGAMGISRQILSNMQNHYPERLGAACPVNVPWLGSLFMTLLLPFVDSDTRSKIWLNPDFTKELIAPEQLLKEYGGQLDFEFSDEYVDALVDLCVQRRAANMERWKAAGGVIGVSEWDIFEPIPSA